MTKAELLAALAPVPDDAPVFIDAADGILRSQVAVDATYDENEKWMVIISWSEIEEDAA
jgi:hypothetical protein